MRPTMHRFFAEVPAWSLVVPIVALVLLLVTLQASGWAVLVLAGLALLGVVVAAVHHAERIAQRIGEPFGALVLALSVTMIEVSLIVSMMLSDAVDSSGLVRDTVFATVMIVCNGVVGLCLLVGALKHRVLGFRVEGTTPALAVLATLATLVLIMPVFTFQTEGPTFSNSQLVFAAVCALLLYGVFIFVQTVRHQDYFLPEASDMDMDAAVSPHGRPSRWVAWTSFALLIASLVAVVGLAESLAPQIEAAIETMGLPHAVLGIVIALLVLLPETMAAVRCASTNRMQISFNLALGSALASIGLTIPVVAVLSIALDMPMNLGLGAKEIVLLALTLFLTATTLTGGRATILQGAVHLVLFAAFVFLTMVP